MKWHNYKYNSDIIDFHLHYSWRLFFLACFTSTISTSVPLESTAVTVPHKTHALLFPRDIKFLHCCHHFPNIKLLWCVRKLATHNLDTAVIYFNRSWKNLECLLRLFCYAFIKHGIYMISTFSFQSNSGK